MKKIEFLFDGTPEELYKQLENLFNRWLSENRKSMEYIQHEGRNYLLSPKPEREDDLAGKIWHIRYVTYSYQPVEGSTLIGLTIPEAERLIIKARMQTGQYEDGILITVGIATKHGTPVTLEYGLDLWQNQVDQILKVLGCQPDTGQESRESGELSHVGATDANQQTTTEAPVQSPVPQRKRPGRKPTPEYIDAYKRIYEKDEDRAAVIGELVEKWTCDQAKQGVCADASMIEEERKRIASGINYQVKKHRKQGRQLNRTDN